VNDGRDERWADLGRGFAQDQLQQTSSNLSTAFNLAAKAAREDTLTGDDLERCYHALQDAEILVDQLAEIPEDYERAPRVEEMLDQDELQELFLD